MNRQHPLLALADITTCNLHALDFSGCHAHTFRRVKLKFGLRAEFAPSRAMPSAQPPKQTRANEDYEWRQQTALTTSFNPNQLQIDGAQARGALVNNDFSLPSSASFIFGG